MANTALIVHWRCDSCKALAYAERPGHFFMTITQHIMFGLATLATIPLAPALTLPAIGAWLLMAWLGRDIDEPANVASVEGSASGCGLTMLLIAFVGLAAMALVLVGGAAMAGRL